MLIDNIKTINQNSLQYLELKEAFNVVIILSKSYSLETSKLSSENLNLRPPGKEQKNLYFLSLEHKATWHHFLSYSVSVWKLWGRCRFFSMNRTESERSNILVQSKAPS